MCPGQHLEVIENYPSKLYKSFTFVDLLFKLYWVSIKKKKKKN